MKVEFLKPTKIAVDGYTVVAYAVGQIEDIPDNIGGALEKGGGVKRASEPVETPRKRGRPRKAK